MTSADLDPTVAYYISHLHVATAAFIISTGIAVAGLSWYGVRNRRTWAWATAIVAAVVGLALELPMHWTADAFAHDWVTHLGPIYLATGVFLVVAVISYCGLRTGYAEDWHVTSLLIDCAGLVLHLAEDLSLRVYLLRMLASLLAVGGVGVTVLLGLRVIDVVRSKGDSPPAGDDSEL